MSRRVYTINLQCAEPGCREWSFAEAETIREEREIRARYAKNPYRCFRHTKTNEVLSADNPETTKTLVVEEKFYTDYRGNEKLLGLYFGHSGIEHGPGFRAIAKDFPPGTKLIVTARIEMPETEGGAA
jgi:hypothetical protein